MSTVSQIEKALLLAANVRSYFAPEIWALHPVERESFPTIACDRWARLYYGKEVFDVWSLPEQAGVIIGMVYRLNLNHFGRGMLIKAFPNIWQLASSLETHDQLLGDRIILPGDPITPKKIGLPRDKPAEWYYERLLEIAGQQVGNDQIPEPDPQPSNQLPTPDNACAGSCADGQKYDWEDAEKSEPGKEVPPAKTQDDMDSLRNLVAERIKGRGDVPNNLQRWAEDLLEPKADWRQELRALVRSSVEQVRGNDNYTYRRPSRRSPTPDFILPANIASKVSIAVVIDTSGSMGNSELSQAVAEVGAILRDVPWCDSVQVLACDAMTHKARKCFRKEQIVLSGGGGTDMRVGIADALKLSPRPNVIVVITDGWTPWPKEEPRAKIVAALTKKPTDHSLPLYAKMVLVDPKG